MRELVLASSSRWRREILENAGISLRVVEPKVDESLCVEADPVAHASTLAGWKARAVFKLCPEDWVLGADQVMWDGQSVRGKPLTEGAHFDMLCGLRGKTHWLHTAFCLLSPVGQYAAVCSTRLRVRKDLSDREIQAYVETKEGRYCAGGYAIEGHGAWLFEEVEGDWFNVVGLPLFQVIRALREMGWRYGE